MKRLISLILVTVMMYLLTGCDLKPKQPEQYTLPDAGYAVNATDMAVVGDKIYYISDEKVYETASEAVVFEEFPVSRIAAAGDTFAVFGGGHVKIGEDSYTLPVSEITSLVCVGNTIGYTYRENDLEMLGFVNRKNGDSISIPPLTEGQLRMLPYTDTEILIHCIGTTDGYDIVYSFNTETMKPGSVMAEDISILHAGYHAIENALYYLDGNAGGNHMTRYDIETTETTSLIPADPLRMNVEKFLFSGESAIILKYSGTLQTSGTFAKVEEGITDITVIIPSSAGNAVAMELESLIYILKRDYQINLVISEVSDEKFAQKQLAKDTDYDLYIGSVGTGSNLSLKYPVWEPLEGYSQITEQTEGLLDEIVRISSVDGHIFGVPRWISTGNCFMGYDAALAEELGISMPDADWTLQEFYNLAVDLREQDCWIAEYVPLYLRDYRWQYFDPYGTGTLNDDGTALRELLVITKKLLQEELLYSGDSSGDARILFNNDSSSFLWLKKDVCLQPTIIGEQIYSDDCQFLMMNAFSKNKNAAACVIAEFLNPENEILTLPGAGCIYKDVSLCRYSGKPTNFAELLDAAPSRLEELLAKAEERAESLNTNDYGNMDAKTEENYALYLDCLAHMKLGVSYGEWDRFANEEAQKYWNDQQDLDYTVQRIIDRAKLILEE